MAYSATSSSFHPVFLLETAGLQAAEKITENIVSYYSEEDTSIDGLEKIHNIVKAWSDYMVDLTYLCGQTNKMLGNFLN